MKSIIIYYSYTGHSKAIAEKLAESESADILEIKDAKRPNKVMAYASGCAKALQGKGWEIEPINTDLTAYDNVTLVSPVWASNTPPAVNTFLEFLPANATVSVKMISAGGTSKAKERLEKIIKEKHSVLGTFEDIKG
jgi:flavodoxin